MSSKPTYEELERRINALEKEVAERKRVEAELREIEDQYRLLYKNAPLPYQSLDENGLILMVNPAWLDTLGYPKEEVLGKSFGDFLHPDWADHFKENFPRFKDVGEVLGVEFEMVREDGSLIATSFNGKIGRDENGQFVQTHCIFQDITPRKRAEVALQGAEHKYRMLLECLPQKIFHKDRNSVYVSCNENYARDLKIKPEEVSGKTDYEFFPKGLAEKYREDDKRIVTLKKTEEIEEKYIQEGQEVWVQTVKTPVKDEKGDITGVLGIFWDITERKRAEEALHQGEEKYRGIFDESIAAVYVFDEKKHFIDSNQAGLDLLGYSKDELLSMSIPDVDADPVVVLPAHKQLLSGENIVNYEHQLRRKDGMIITVLNNSKPLTDAKENIIGMQSTLIDITKRKQAEDELKNHRDHLEELVAERTNDLRKSNEELRQEITERKRAEKQLLEANEKLSVQTRNLEKLNTALKVLLEHREKDKGELEDKVVSNAKELIIPYVEDLKRTPLDTKQEVYVSIIESNLKEIVSPFLRKLTSKYFGLTPKEVQVAGLIKQGKTSKEIAELFNVSTRAVQFHRQNIRAKLGLKNRQANLGAYLMSLS
jgi:PAS domain S-box-containing protein